MKTATRYLYIKRQPSALVMRLRQRGTFKLISIFLVATGVSLIFYVAFPIVSWQFFYAPSLFAGNVLSPIPKVLMVKQTGIGNVLADASGGFLFGANLTYASSWFPTGNPSSNIHKEYSLKIAKLGIKNAKVIVGSDDLSKSLIHYGGSSMPGEYGNAVIFGHSILPQFFDPNNYKAIFSTLHTLKLGDTIEIFSDDVSYTYKIIDFKVVDPLDISVLEQTYDNSYLTVITCTPPGTYWKRLVVKARVV